MVQFDVEDAVVDEVDQLVSWLVVNSSVEYSLSFAEISFVSSFPTSSRCFINWSVHSKNSSNSVINNFKKRLEFSSIFRRPNFCCQADNPPFPIHTFF